jgi:hydroxyacylglutathione hydrolase
MKKFFAVTLLVFSFSTYAQERHTENDGHDHHDHVRRILRDFEDITKPKLDCVSPAPVSPLDEESQKIADKKWFGGAPDCRKPESRTPPYEVLEVNKGYYIMRQNKCINFEAPFIYLYIGETGALLIDTGSTSSAEQMPLRAWVDEVLKKQPNGDKLKLVVAHSHSHGDHTAGDGQFRDRPNTTVVGTDPEEVAAAFNIKDWPNGQGEIDLGNRKMSVMAIPGHEPSSIAVYDHQSGDMVTGDSLYPGNIFLSEYNYPEFKASVNRMHAFSQKNKVRNYLGAHVEMSAEPGVDYEYGSTNQPNEHKLPLRQEHLDELKTYIDANPRPARKVFADFIIAL